MRRAQKTWSVMPALLIGLGSAEAQDLATHTRALVVIAETANSICYTVAQEGYGSALTLSGDATTRLTTKLAELGVKGSGQFRSDQYQGVFQHQLAETLVITQKCKERVFDMLVERILPPITQRTGLPLSQSLHLRPRTTEKPSIPCDRITEPIENLLCADADLAEWDGRMVSYIGIAVANFRRPTEKSSAKSSSGGSR
jgi:hypothetical protein